jgi:hypothetical protein
MSALIEVADKARTRQLIFEEKGGKLSEEEAKVLEHYLTFSSKLCVGTVDGVLCCAWGLVPPSLISQRAYLWLFSTQAVDQHKFLFIRHSQVEVNKMLEEYPLITGYCKLGQDRSIRWLRWLGAVFSEPQDKDFLPFEIRRK